MPNHVKNIITVNNGTHKQRLAFLNAVINSEGYFDFNRLVYRPKSLEITSGGHTALFAGALVSGKLGKKSLAELRNKLGEEAYRRGLREGKLYHENIEKYGYGTWYEWSRDNWGTKWNAYSQEMPVKQRKSRQQRGYRHRLTHVKAYEKRLYKKQLKNYIANGGDLIISFDTAWCIPEPVYHAMAARFPHLDIEIKYADEDWGSNCGHLQAKNGVLLEVDVAPMWRDQTEEEHIKWRAFAFHLNYGDDADPKDFDMNDNYEYVEDDEE